MGTARTIAELNRRFVYTRDKTPLDSWNVLWAPGNGRLRGDCDDYAMSALHIACGGSEGMMVRWILGDKAQFWRTTTKRGDAHVMLCVESRWIDNITKDWMREPHLDPEWKFPAALIALPTSTGILKRAGQWARHNLNRWF